PNRVRFCAHHHAHAAAAFLPSGFADAAVLVVDGVGEWATTSLWRGRDGKLEPLSEQLFPDSLGLFQSALTQYLGFEPEKDEHKLEALAAYGTPRFADRLLEVVRLEPHGVISIDPAPFRFRFDGDLLFGPGLVELLGPVRIPGGPLDTSGGDSRFVDVAASVQEVLERALLHLAKHAHEVVGSPRLCVGGCLALNATALGRLHSEGPFDELFVESLAHDGGAALGAALLSASMHGPVRTRDDDWIGLGDEVRLVAEETPGLEREDAPGRLEARVAEALEAGALVGYVRGRSAWSPDALGRRSLFGDPRRADARRALNDRVARRDPFLPLRAVTTCEAAARFFEVPDGADAALRGGSLVLRARPETVESLPAVVHANGTARVQVVDARTQPGLHRLLSAFDARTGVALLAEADLAVRGEPPVRGAHEALQLFERTDLDLLVLEDRLLERARAGVTPS
ncbi:MAG: hypothetical protein KDC14_17965, partial [Planctomycetes bacterium]|nr:hypothetical protein [Planctomycetota bacterium]